MPSLAVVTASQVVSELPEEDTTLMTAANIRRLCKEHGLYLMPNLNDRLYLQVSVVAPAAALLTHGAAGPGVPKDRKLGGVRQAKR